MRAERRDEGLPYLFEAADAGYPVAFSNIGGTYQFDLGNYAEALKWYRKGADIGDVASQTHLAEMYLDGVGVEQNLAEALRWYEPSAANGYSLSEYKIGLIYLRGDQHVRRDPERAITWFRKAAENGFARAQNDLGWAYETGEGVSGSAGCARPVDAGQRSSTVRSRTCGDYQKAEFWYRRAAEQGWAQAQVNLGRLLENGLGTERNEEDAFYWYRLASDAREDGIRRDARQGVTRVRPRLNGQQIASVDQRVRSVRWVTANESAEAIADATKQGDPSAVDTAYVPPGEDGQRESEVDTAYVPPDDTGQAIDDGYVPPGSDTDVDAAYVPPDEVEPAENASAEAERSDVDVAYTPPDDPASTAVPDTVEVSAPVEIVPVDGAYRATSNSNVRSAPTTNASKIGGVARGDTVAVLGQVTDRNWYQVELTDGSVGYIFGDLLEQTPETTLAAQTPPDLEETTAGAASSTDLGIDLSQVDFGSYHALVIGNNEYRDFPTLKTAVNDAKAVASLLDSAYGFKVQLMLDATREDIVSALDQYRRILSPKDNLLVYYAGHGYLDYGSGRGYWLPVDAATDTQVRWVSNATITDTLKATDAKHIMLVVDSCYSGTLTRGVTVTLHSPEYLRRMVAKRARVVLTSGGLEPVVDSGDNGHSVFANAFLKALRENNGLMDGTELFVKVRRPVMLGAPQTPAYADVRFAGHDGGDFLFVRR